MNNVENEIISLFVRLADLLSLPRSVGEIYGTLYISSNPLCLDEIKNKLKISKGSTSQGLKILRSFGAIKIIYIAGDRKDFYIAEDSLRKIARGFANEQIIPHIESGSDRLLNITNLLKEDHDLDKEFLNKRIKKLRTWQNKANKILPVVLKLIGDQKKWYFQKISGLILFGIV